MLDFGGGRAVTRYSYFYNIKPVVWIFGFCVLKEVTLYGTQESHAFSAVYAFVAVPKRNSASSFNFHKNQRFIFRRDQINFPAAHCHMVCHNAVSIALQKLRGKFFSFYADFMRLHAADCNIVK